MKPDISVVVSTYDRAHLLRPLLAALLGQEGVNHEIVVVDNGSADETPAVLTAAATDAPERMRVMRIENNRGPARARNVGWRAARAPLIAFTDDDCVPDPGWLAALSRAAEDLDVVQGRTRPDPAVQRRWWDRSQTLGRWTGRFETCNLLVRRDFLEITGGFNESFDIAMGEDTDLGLRAVAAGARTGFCPDATVVHHVWPRTFTGYLVDRVRWAEVVALVRHNPKARAIFPLPFASKISHLVVLAAVPIVPVALLVGAWWVVPVGIACWCLWYARRTRWRRRPWPVRFAYGIPSLVALIWETICFVRASIRHRVLVL